MGVEHEIVKHLKLCASLMSDPDTLRDYPEIVANQFLVAKRSIEVLNQFLVPKPVKPVDPCECHDRNWLDSSIISKGIGVLVTKTLKTHMDVVRKSPDDFPRIVREDLRSPLEGGGENFLVREMKETNCMGSIILLYYYLYWYLLLILMNKRYSNDALYCDEGQLDVNWLINNLPSSYDFLEFRHLGGCFRRSKVTDTRADVQILKEKVEKEDLIAGKFMFAKTDFTSGFTHKARKTILVATYRRALATNLPGGNMVDSSIEFQPDVVVASPSLLIFNAISNQSLLYGMLVMGGMIPELECQSSVRKWEEMDTLVQVKCLKAGKVCICNGKLIDIISNRPYSTDPKVFKVKATQACIFDYCSASLMMDICRSFHFLAETVTMLLASVSDEIVSGFLISFTADMCSENRGKQGLRFFLDNLNKSKKTLNLMEEEYNFVNKTYPTWSDPEKTKILRGGVIKQGTPLWVDRFRGIYPSRNDNYSEEVNHKCFIWDLGVDRTEDALQLIQTAIGNLDTSGTGHPFCMVYSSFLLTSFLCNTWIVTHGIDSIKYLLDSNLVLNKFRNASKNHVNDLVFDAHGSALEEVKEHHGVGVAGFSFVFTDDLVRHLELHMPLRMELVLDDSARIHVLAEMKKVFDDQVDKSAIRICDISRGARWKQGALVKLGEASKKFNKYPALMWPVTFTGGDNESFFKEVSKRMESLGNPKGIVIATHGPNDPRRSGGVSAAQRLAIAAETIASAVQHHLPLVQP